MEIEEDGVVNIEYLVLDPYNPCFGSSVTEKISENTLTYFERKAE